MMYRISQTAIATLLAATSATAQEVDPRIEAMVSELYAEGYTEFTLNDYIFTPPTLVAEQAAILLRLRLDPDTLAPTAASMALDTDGDGILSASERRSRLELVDASGQAIVAVNAINEVTNRIEQHMQQVSMLAQSLGGAGGWIGGGRIQSTIMTEESCEGGGSECYYDPIAHNYIAYEFLSPVGKALADGTIGGGVNRDAVRDAARDAAAPAINDRANDARDTARDAISDRVSDRR